MLTPLDCPEKFYHSILSTINKAKSGDFIHVNYFVIKEDDRGLSLLATIYQALKRKVNVQIIVDCYGSMHPGDDGTEYDGNPLTHELLKVLEKAGGVVKIFHPIHSTKKLAIENLKNWKWYTRRNHNKLFLFDLKSIQEQGIVVGDSQWAEEHFTDVFRGNNVLVQDKGVFEKAKSYSETLIHSSHVQFSKKVLLTRKKIRDIQGKLDDIYRLLDIDDDWQESLPCFESESIEFVFNELDFTDPMKRKTIQDRELELIQNAKKFVWYSTPYFGPDRIMQKGFIDTEKVDRVELKILIAKFRDHPFLPYGTKKAASHLIRHGIKIYEYNGNGNIHYKDLLVDDISFIKSANGEGRSRFFNLETGVIVKSKEYTEYNKNHMFADIKQSIKLHKKSKYLEERHLMKRLFKYLLCPMYYHHL